MEVVVAVAIREEGRVGAGGETKIIDLIHMSSNELFHFTLLRLYSRVIICLHNNYSLVLNQRFFALIYYIFLLLNTNV